VPIVTAAQDEKHIELPVQLDLPWNYLQKYYGFKSPAGNVRSHFVCNTDKKKKLLYATCANRAEWIKDSEENFTYLFRDIEDKVSFRPILCQPEY
jgi:hypothetical protein